MKTTYFYVDESFQQKGEHWHCNIGGMLLSSAQAVDVEIALETDLLRLATTAGVSVPVSECKYSNFLRETSDDFKISVCKSVANLLIQHQAKFLVSHAKCRTSHLRIFKNLSPPLAIQQLGRVNTNSDGCDCVGQSGAWRSRPHNSPPLSTACPSSVATSA